MMMMVMVIMMMMAWPRGMQGMDMGVQHRGVVGGDDHDHGINDDDDIGNEGCKEWNQHGG